MLFLLNILSIVLIFSIGLALILKISIYILLLLISNRQHDTKEFFINNKYLSSIDIKRNEFLKNRISKYGEYQRPSEPLVDSNEKIDCEKCKQMCHHDSIPKSIQQPEIKANIRTYENNYFDERENIDSLFNN